MSRITTIFNDLKQNNQKAFIPFVTAGDGGLDLSLELMQTYADNGANIIEIGMPFSDPMADGPVIAASHERAVKDGVNLDDVFTLVKNFRKINNQIGIVLMGYLNPIEIYGYEQFSLECKNFGVDGVLIVDNPPEEAGELKQLLSDNGIDFIFLVAPTTTDDRLKFLASVVSGFVYFVSLKGVTGSSAINIYEVNQNLKRIQKYIDLPVCVGFGVKDAQTAKAVTKNSQGAIVATTFVKFIAKYPEDRGKIVANIKQLAKEISEGLNELD
jgi:tryptophan synthase alpha chain